MLGTISDDGYRCRRLVLMSVMDIAIGDNQCCGLYKMPLMMVVYQVGGVQILLV